MDRALLWKVLQTFGCPPRLAKIVQEFHDGTKGMVAVGGDRSEEIMVSHSTKQGCVLAPTLFALYLTVVLMILHQEAEEGIYVRTRIDGKLFNIARLKAKTKTNYCLQTTRPWLHTVKAVSKGWWTSSQQPRDAWVCK